MSGEIIRILVLGIHRSRQLFESINEPLRG